MNKTTYENYVLILKEELIPALGCTEPIAIAFAAAKARDMLATMPEHIYIRCSGNIIKNVKGVTVPNSGGLIGINAAAILGTVGGDASNNLEVLNSIEESHITKTKELLNEDFCKCDLAEGVENLYIYVKAIAGNETATVEIRSKHTHITEITKNGAVIFSQADLLNSVPKADRSLLNLADILEFAYELRISDVEDILEQQIQMNKAIAQEGILQPYGAQVGRTLLNNYISTDVRTRAKAMAAAGSDARMNGCPLPVVINSGSGNQGLTVSLPVIEYAEEYNAGRDKLYRALVISNLIAILQKYYIGSLSAFCGAVSAATGAACGICYLGGGSYKEISDTITNTLCNVGGIVCDGAKSSCAAKIAAALDAAILGMVMATQSNTVFTPGEGLVQDNVENTIKSIGRVGRCGMKSTDIEILNIMLGN